MIKRFVLGNLIYIIDEDNILLVNLTSFRRKNINKNILSSILEMENKINNKVSLSQGENNILDNLYNDKQVFSKDKILEVDQTLQIDSELFMDKFPVKSITLNLTHQCNFKCLYCYQNKYNNNPKYRQLFMTTHDIDLINNYFSQDIFNVDEIKRIIFTGGESLLPQNINTINYVLENLKSQEYIIYTNGVNLFDYKNKIDYNKISKFQISLDGTDEIIKCINQCSDSKVFNKIIDGIKYVETLNKEISIVVMWTKELEQYIDEFISLLKTNDIINKPNIEIRFVLSEDMYSIDKIDKNFYDFDYLCNISKKINPKLSQIGSFLELYQEIMLLKSIIHRPMNNRKYIKFKSCDLAKSVPMVIEPNGEIFFCTCLGHENGLIGNYKENIYFDKEKVLKIGNRTIYKIRECKNCDLRYICGAGCPSPLTSFNSDLHKPVCGLFGLDEFWNRLEEIV